MGLQKVQAKARAGQKMADVAKETRSSLKHGIVHPTHEGDLQTHFNQLVERLQRTGLEEWQAIVELQGLVSGAQLQVVDSLLDEYRQELTGDKPD